MSGMTGNESDLKMMVAIRQRSVRRQCGIDICQSMFSSVPYFDI